MPRRLCLPRALACATAAVFMLLMAPGAARAQPTISSITPTSGPTAGGITLTIQGTNFGTLATATVDGNSCPVTQQTDSTLECTLPPGSGLDVPVEVTVSGQVSNQILFDYVDSVCGDNVVEGAEDCEDGNTVSGDCCSASCEYETGACDDGDDCTQETVCQLGVCGGGTLEPDGTACSNGEECWEFGTCSFGTCSGLVPVADGTPCDDVDDCAVDDQCQLGVCTPGPKAVLDGEPCDDGEGCTVADQCLTGVCTGTPEADDTPCDDGDTCTQIDTCQGGVCTGDDPQPDGNSCDDDDLCTAADECAGGRCVGNPSPQACRVPVQADRASLTIVDKPGTATDKLKWRWQKGEATTLAEYEDPTMTTLYTLCLYKLGAPAPLMSLPLAAETECPAAEAPCWELKGGSKYKYGNKLRTPAGIDKALLGASDVDGKPKSQIQGRGPLLGVPATPINGDLRVELRNSDSSLCWGADLDDVQTNRRGQYKARGE